MDVARRLRVTRLALGFKHQNEFAEAAGVGRTNYSQAESGARLLSLPVAFQLNHYFGTSLDWLYLGDRSNLRARLRDAIREQERKDEATDEAASDDR